jgi:hypothetical protein
MYPSFEIGASVFLKDAMCSVLRPGEGIHWLKHKIPIIGKISLRILLPGAMLSSEATQEHTMTDAERLALPTEATRDLPADKAEQKTARKRKPKAPTAVWPTCFTAKPSRYRTA